MEMKDLLKQGITEALKQPSPPTDSACATPAVPYTGIITAPSDDINIPAYKISETCSFELLAIYIIDSASDMLYPLRFERLPAIIARPPDKTMPTVVPIIAQTVFEEIYVKLCKIFQNIIIDYHCLFSSFNSFSLNSHFFNV